LKTAFFLRSSSDGQASIYIRITEGRGDQFKFATGHAVLRPDHWNKAKQRVRNKVEAVGCDEVNVQLDKLQAFVRQANLDAKTKGQRRDRDFYLQVIQDFKRGVERSSVGQTITIGEAFERFIDHASKHNSPITGSRLSKGTLENYAVTLRQIRHVLMDSTTLDEVDMDWYHDFVSKSEQSGLNGKPLSKNYIGRHIKGVKSVLAAMEEQGHDVHPAYRRKGFKKITEDSMSIWLTMDELKQMEALDLSGHAAGLSLTRDLFLIGCFTGLRVSDLNRLKSAELVTLEGTQCFSFNQKKTGQPVLIPVHPVVHSILDRHNGSPRPQNDQIINRNLKRLGRLMQLDESIQVDRTVGGEKTKERKSKWMMLTSHCARRSFCTNAILNGADTLTIMAMSGHKTEKTLRCYLKLGPEHYTSRMASSAFFNP
jgi:integrase